MPLFIPNLPISIVCYGSAYQNQTRRLKNIINRAIKVVFNTSVVTSDLLKREKMLDFDLAYNYFCAINMYKILRLNNHVALATKINSFQTHHLHQTRAVTNEDLSLPLYRLTKCQNSFIYRGLQFWNSLPSNIHNVQNNLNAFKRLLKHFILDQL